MRLIGTLVVGIILGIILFGPIKDYWIGILHDRTSKIEARVSGIEQYLVDQQKKAVPDAQRQGK